MVTHTRESLRIPFAVFMGEVEKRYNLEKKTNEF